MLYAEYGLGDATSESDWSRMALPSLDGDGAAPAAADVASLALGGLDGSVTLDVLLSGLRIDEGPIAEALIAVEPSLNLLGDLT